MTVGLPAVGVVHQGGPGKPYQSVALKLEAIPAQSPPLARGFAVCAVTWEMLDAWERDLVDGQLCNGSLFVPNFRVEFSGNSGALHAPGLPGVPRFIRIQPAIAEVVWGMNTKKRRPGSPIRQALQRRADTDEVALEVFSDVKRLIDEARQRVSVSVNAELTMLYWRVGKRIQSEVLGGERAEYGKQVLTGLSKALTQIYGAGWGEKQLRHCLRAAEILSEENVYTLCRQLSWSHLRLVIYTDDEMKRSFYLEMAAMERWSVRQLSERIQSMLYERTAISKKPEEPPREVLHARFRRAIDAARQRLGDA